MKKSPRTHAFTLIELSVVIVVIGLLLGAVVGGQALIRNAEMQSIMSDAFRYKEAVLTFKKQYNALPGDMTDATEFWGISSACSGSDANGTCNGDGNKELSYGSASNTGEAFQFWRQLALAGRITGTFSGVAGASSRSHSTPNVNVPAGRIAGSGWDSAGATYVADSQYFNTYYGNFLRVGKTSGSNQSYTPLLTPEQAWKIDTKMDDGKPGRGTIIASHPVNQCAAAANVNDLDAAYKFAAKGEQCTLFFVNLY